MTLQSHQHNDSAKTHTLKHCRTDCGYTKTSVAMR